MHCLPGLETSEVVDTQRVGACGKGGGVSTGIRCGFGCDLSQRLLALWPRSTLGCLHVRIGVIGVPWFGRDGGKIYQDRNARHLMPL